MRINIFYNVAKINFTIVLDSNVRELRPHELKSALIWKHYSTGLITDRVN